MPLLAEERIFSTWLKVFDVEELPTNGGSIRVFAQRPDGTREETERLLAVGDEEHRFSLMDLATYEPVATCIAAVCDVSKFHRQHQARRQDNRCRWRSGEGKHLSECLRLPHVDIVFLVARSTLKQGNLLPGSHIPVYAPDHLDIAKSDTSSFFPGMFNG